MTMPLDSAAAVVITITVCSLLLDQAAAAISYHRRKKGRYGVADGPDPKQVFQAVRSDWLALTARRTIQRTLGPTPNKTLKTVYGGNKTVYGIKLRPTLVSRANPHSALDASSGKSQSK